MLKKLQKILLIAIIMVAVMSTMCLASEAELTSIDQDQKVTTISNGDDAVSENATTTGSEEESETEPSTDAEASEESPEQDMLLDDLYLIDNSVNYSRIIDGNAYIIGNDVTISSIIGGDLFVLGNNVTLTKDCVVYGNLFLLANTANLDCYVYGGNLYAACSDLTVGENGAIYRDMKVTSSKLSFNGAVGRNAYVSGNEIALGEKTKIYGDFNYSSSKAIEVPSEAVSGTINYSEIKNNNSEEAPSSPVVSKLIDLAYTLIYTLIVFGLIVLLARKFHEKLQSAPLNKVAVTSLKGLAILVATPIVAIILICTIVGIPVAIALIAVWLLLVCGFASVVATISVASFISAKVPVLAKAHGLLGVIVVTIVLWLLELIPFVGGLVSLIACIYGLGLIFVGNFKKKEKVQEENTVVE